MSIWTPHKRERTLVSDEEIIAQVLDGHTERYAELVRKYQGAAYRLAYRVLGRREEAEDAVQETFVRAYEKLASCRDRGRFWPWMRRIALNVCLRRMSRETPCENVVEMRDAGTSLANPVEAEVVRRAEISNVQTVL